LRREAYSDVLTGLHNRRFLLSQIRNDVAQSRRAYRGPSVFPNRDIVFMMIDLDRFKEINDSHGHGAGDRVLRQYAELVTRQIRESDYVVRWGGEEFLIVARNTESAQCAVIAERLLDAVRAADFVIDDKGTRLKCTCSVGISHFPFLRHLPDVLDWEQIVDIADIAVYMAKALGRDGWVTIHGTDAMPPEQAAATMEHIKSDLRTVIENGWITVEGSYDNLLDAAPEGWRPKNR
jgi:diguanylate cyclase (GGDEF)-like protein